MTLMTDHSFHIGEQHLRNGKPCQDYALSGKLSDDLAYAIVSDGCSSGGMTDIGARLMALATKQALLEHGTDIGTQVDVINAKRDAYLKTYCTTLGLDIRDLLATSMWAIAHKDWVFANVTGDGVVVIQHEDDHEVHRFDWHKNMPYYPAYGIGDMDESFKDSMSDNPKPLTHINEGLAPVGMGGCRDGVLMGLSAEAGMGSISISAGHLPPEEFQGPIKSIALFSDGIEQIDQVGYDQAIQELMAFKSTKGKFAVRRMNRFLQETKKAGRGPIDDIAIAVIHLGNTNET